ncbi:hypothetical protein FRACYDRAFT_250570 [Fragilariopsis cylindrus CCMP1102]|uniref:Uncharacterized protein n=1 Tax=Fragilariopsis cylindrus CCMP1102 TaxID=635003 RepID=A0A1E7EPR0_9STRA|nr:hypothetical protein FRACYDRAFT_250570 [Fragilariopsis cylindrus CCMP1102]|eukprot:OEU07938.1 hypothetical protein FRACYDRAFT_250570 [Fragilariopsis cylindrus CCMP1102]
MQCLCSGGKNNKSGDEEPPGMVEGKHNVLVHYIIDVSAPYHLVLSSATVSNEIVCCPLFLIENHVVCVPAITVEQIQFRNHREVKVVGGTYNDLVHYVDACSPDPSGVVDCNPFK